MGARKGGLEIEIVDDVDGTQSSDDSYGPLIMDGLDTAVKAADSGEWMLSGEDEGEDEPPEYNGLGLDTEITDVPAGQSQLVKQQKQGNTAARLMLITGLLASAAFGAREYKQHKQKPVVAEAAVEAKVWGAKNKDADKQVAKPITEDPETKEKVPTSYPRPETALLDLTGPINKKGIALTPLEERFYSKLTRNNPDKKDITHCKQNGKKADFHDLEGKVFSVKGLDCSNLYKGLPKGAGTSFYMVSDLMLADDKAGKKAHIEAIVGSQAAQVYSWVVEGGSKKRRKIYGSKESGLDTVKLGQRLILFETDQDAAAYVAKHSKKAVAKKRKSRKHKKKRRVQKSKKQRKNVEYTSATSDIDSVLAEFHLQRGGDVYCVVRGKRKKSTSYQIAKREGNQLRMYSIDGTAQQAVPYTKGLRAATTCSYGTLRAAQKAAGYTPQKAEMTPLPKHVLQPSAEDKPASGIRPLGTYVPGIEAKTQVTRNLSLNLGSIVKGAPAKKAYLEVQGSF